MTELETAILSYLRERPRGVSFNEMVIDLWQGTGTFPEIHRKHVDHALTTLLERGTVISQHSGDSYVFWSNEDDGA